MKLVLEVQYGAHSSAVAGGRPERPRAPPGGPDALHGSGQLPLPRSVPLGYLVNRLQAEDQDEGFTAELTYNLLRSDSSVRVLALHPFTGELSLQQPLSFQPSGPLTAVVEVSDGGRPTLSCTATLLLVPTDPVPPGGRVVLVPPPPPLPLEGAEGPVWKSAAQGAARQPDLSAVWVGVLASGCGHPHCDLFL